MPDWSIDRLIGGQIALVCIKLVLIIINNM